MKDLLFTCLKILIIFAIAVVILNDAGAIIMTKISQGDLAQVVVDTAVSAYKTSHSPAETQIAAENIAKQRGLKLTNFYIDNKTITVTVEVPPKKTFIIHRISTLKSLLSATSTVSADLESPPQ